MDASSSNEDEFIPCELCETMIPFQQYQQHVLTCRGTVMPSAVFNYRIQDDVLGMVQIPIPMSLLQRVASRMHAPDDEDHESDSNEVVPQSEQQRQRMLLRLRVIEYNTPETMPLEDSYEINSMLSELIGNVDCGIPDIQRVTEVVPKEDAEALDADAICPICQDVFNDLCKQDVCLRKTLCHHTFCDPCLAKWFGRSKRCPMCMADVWALSEPKN